MPSPNDPIPTASRAVESKAWIQLLAAAAGVLPLYLGLISYQLLGSRPPSVQGFIVYLGLVCPLAIVAVVLLLRFLCEERLRDLDLKRGRLATDLFAAAVLSMVILAANIVSNVLFSTLLPSSEPDLSIRNLFTYLASNPGLVVVFVALLMPLGAASEEIVRVFFLSRVWKVLPSPPGNLVAVIISAVLFGLIHLYRGPAAIVWTAVFGLIMALYYLRFGRTTPLILAHYATNALQVLVFAALAR
jgi:membrane protease YdiL (CAAX protease family)